MQNILKIIRCNPVEVSILLWKIITNLPDNKKNKFNIIWQLSIKKFVFRTLIKFFGIQAFKFTYKNTALTLLVLD